jgi:transcriptional regulator with XRE-family HTH domain
MSTRTTLDLAETGGRMRARRLELGWTQQRLAGELGTSQARVSDWETGRFEMLSGTLLRVCTALDVSSDWVMGLAE